MKKSNIITDESRTLSGEYKKITAAIFRKIKNPTKLTKIDNIPTIFIGTGGSLTGLKLLMTAKRLTNKTLTNFHNELAPLDFFFFIDSTFYKEKITNLLKYYPYQIVFITKSGETAEIIELLQHVVHLIGTDSSRIKMISTKKFKYNTVSKSRNLLPFKSESELIHQNKLRSIVPGRFSFFNKNVYDLYNCFTDKLTTPNSNYKYTPSILKKILSQDLDKDTVIIDFHSGMGKWLVQLWNESYSNNKFGYFIPFEAPADNHSSLEKLFEIVTHSNKKVIILHAPEFIHEANAMKEFLNQSKDCIVNVNSGNVGELVYSMMFDLITDKNAPKDIFTNSNVALYKELVKEEKS